MVVDTEKVLQMISTQLFSIVESNVNLYGNLRFFIEEEQFFYPDEDMEPGTICVVVEFMAASIDYGQTAIPVVLSIMCEQNRMDITRKLFTEFAQKYNLVWNEEGNIQQVYEAPEVVSNFNEVFEGFRTTLTMPGAVLFIDSGNKCAVEYFPVLKAENIYYYRKEEDLTEEFNPSIEIKTLKEQVKKEGLNLPKIEDGQNIIFEYWGGIWYLIQNPEVQTRWLIKNIHSYGVSYDGIPEDGDEIRLDAKNGYGEIEYLSLNTASTIQLDSQAFYDNDGFTQSKAQFGSRSINLTSYLFDNDLFNKCLSVYLGDTKREPLGIDTTFKFRITFQSGHVLEKEMKMHSFALQESKGQIPVVNATFSE